MKYFLTLVVFFCFLENSYGQILSDVTLDLNVGGEVYDVAFDEYNNTYVVVGDFDWVQGQSRKNIAFIDANTLTVTSLNPILSIDGIITSVEYVKVAGTNVGWYDHYIYIGGSFDTINGQSKNLMARISATEGLFQQVYGLDNSWTAPFDICGGLIIVALMI